MPSRGFTRGLRATLPQIGHEVIHRGGLVPHALADREAPTTPGEPLPEAISEGELRHIAPHRPGRPDPQRHTYRATQTGGLVLEPRATIVEERRDPDPHEAPQVLRDQQPVLEREPDPACAGELVDSKDAWPVLRVPQIELRARLGPTQLSALDVENQRLLRDVLARDGQAGRNPPRIGTPGREDAVRRRLQHCETTPPGRRDLGTQLRPDARLAGRIAPRARRRPHTDRK